MTWTPIVGQPFTAHGFDAYADLISERIFRAWRPWFVVLHNTSAPTWAQWPVGDRAAQNQRILNLEHYYRDTMGWSAGPHLFISDYIWVFTPLTHPGVHSPSWNHVSWGVELVGDYEREVVPVEVSTNAVAALAALKRAGKLSGNWLRLHKEDPATTHKACPGHNVDRAALLAAIGPP